ncbi:hypothetical protein [Neisseria sp. Ec49-e6-T10]|uniref:hypothetical protein n=1 Tax=Neisseria sp. Ec49-e6-T10 TaxID=3140744 RepID=UPI003EBBF4EF
MIIKKTFVVTREIKITVDTEKTSQNRYKDGVIPDEVFQQIVNQVAFCGRIFPYVDYLCCAPDFAHDADSRACIYTLTDSVSEK